MSVLEMKVPSPGESISEVEIATWLVSDGDYVEKDQAIAEVDSDKATLELPIQYQTGSKFSPGYDISVGTRLTVGANQIYNIGTTGIYDDYTKKFTIDLRSYTQAIVNDELENTELILSPILFIIYLVLLLFNYKYIFNILI
mgnify:CR=1 FL=1